MRASGKRQDERARSLLDIEGGQEGVVILLLLVLGFLEPLDLGLEALDLGLLLVELLQVALVLTRQQSESRSAGIWL